MFEHLKLAFEFIETSFPASMIVALMGAACWELGGFLDDVIASWIRLRRKKDK